MPWCDSGHIQEWPKFYPYLLAAEPVGIHGIQIAAVSYHRCRIRPASGSNAVSFDLESSEQCFTSFRIGPPRLAGLRAAVGTISLTLLSSPSVIARCVSHPKSSRRSVSHLGSSSGNPPGDPDHSALL